MSRLRKVLLVVAMTASMAIVNLGVVSAQDSPDNTAFCASLADSQAQLNTQVADFDASLAALSAQIDAYDAVLGPEYDALLNGYRAQVTNGYVTYHAQVALAQAQITMGVALYGC